MEGKVRRRATYTARRRSVDPPRPSPARYRRRLRVLERGWRPSMSRKSCWSTALAGLVAAVALAPAGARAAPPAAPVPPPTRAALDPSLVAGRGASVGFLEQEAETATNNGTVIGPDRSAYTLPAEASGRKAVRLTPGQHVEFILPKAADGITVRYSIPDAPKGGGITAPLGVTVNGKQRQTMTLTSQYAWLYNLYPFTNDPNADVLHP